MNASEKNPYKDALNEWKSLASEDEERLRFLSQSLGDEEKAKWMYIASRNNKYKKIFANAKLKLISSAIYHSILRAGFWGSWLILIVGVNILLKIAYISIDSGYLYIFIIHGAFHLYVLLLMSVALSEEWRHIKYRVICYLLIALSIVNIGSVGFDAFAGKYESISKDVVNVSNPEKLITIFNAEKACLSGLKTEHQVVTDRIAVTYVLTPLAIKTTRSNEVWILVNVDYKNLYAGNSDRTLFTIGNKVGERAYKCPRDQLLFSSVKINGTWPVIEKGGDRFMDDSHSLDWWNTNAVDKYELLRKLKSLYVF